MLAALLLNQPANAKQGGDDVWRKKNRKQRREYVDKLVKHDELLREQWRERAKIDREMRIELRDAYRALVGIKKHAQFVESVVAPYRDNRDPQEPINWQWMVNSVVDVKPLLILYYDLLDEEALLLLI